jgi:hypothetical protein
MIPDAAGDRVVLRGDEQIVDRGGRDARRLKTALTADGRRCSRREFPRKGPLPGFEPASEAREASILDH